MSRLTSPSASNHLASIDLLDQINVLNQYDAWFQPILSIAGARVLRQDPVECLFEFICSSNNHISRIHGMVERLCRDYGTPILHASTCQASTASAPIGGKGAVAAAEEEQKAVPDLAFYSFPTLEQLSAASEAALRAEGFGYRYHQTPLHCSHECLQDVCNTYWYLGL